MTTKQKVEFNRMFDTLKKISKEYQTIAQLRKNYEKLYGVNYKDALEMSYENLQMEATFCIKGIKKLQ